MIRVCGVVIGAATLALACGCDPLDHLAAMIQGVSDRVDVIVDALPPPLID